MKKILVVLGPTATGKTDLALLLAKKFNGELVSCDSRQVYQGLDIGTGKLPGIKVKVKRYEKYWEMNGIKVWMYDVVLPKKQYSVADYVKDAPKVIGEIIKRGKLPILVGGTGFYLRALLEGLPNLSVPLNKKLRKELERLSLGQLQTRLQKLDPEKFKKLNNSDKQNPRRLLRSIEVSLMYPYIKNKNIEIKNQNYETLKIGLTTPREVLYKSVDLRVLSRLNQGMAEEAEKLHKKGISFKKMRELGLEYGVLADYLEGKIKLKEELVKILQNKIHGYVRRQQTYFKREKNVYWFDIKSRDYLKKIEKLSSKWYYQH